MAAEGALPAGLDMGSVAVEPPRDPAHGDMATNAAMVLSRPARKGPREIAEALAEALAGAPGLTSVEVAGPGFLNLRLDPARWFALRKTAFYQMAKKERLFPSKARRNGCRWFAGS